MRYVLIAFFCCGVLAVTGQRLVSGRVVAEESGQPVAGISVFVNNSSVGTVTAADGGFQLAQVPVGELIVSGISFETQVYTIKPGTTPLNLHFELKTKIEELENVTVDSYITETWEKWGQVFFENLIGRTPVARKCILQNKEVIRFRYYKDKDVLEAVADAPLIIENPQLGYLIRYELQDFKISFTDHHSYYSGYAFFSVREKTSKRAAARNRKKAYLGSAMHFMRALYKDQLAVEEFEVQRVVRVPNKEKERVQGIAAARALQLARMGIMEEQSPDSAAYYQKVMQQTDYTNYYARALLKTDSVLTGTVDNYKVVYWDHFLAVTYHGVTEDPEYLQYIGEPSRSTGYPRSLLQLKGPIVIDEWGNWSLPEDLTTFGYWGWSNSVGDMLPLDYKP